MTACGRWLAGRPTTRCGGWRWCEDARGARAGRVAGVRAKFAAIGDAASVRVIDVILRDEIGHVAVGNRWFRYLCDREVWLRTLLTGSGAPLPSATTARSFQCRRAAAGRLHPAEIDELQRSSG